MSVLVGKQAPDFCVKAVQGGEVLDDFTLSQFRGRYVVLAFYPLDFTFVCPTELHDLQAMLEAFKELGAEVVACSTDSHFSHRAWLQTPKKEGGIQGVTYPIVADFNKTIVADYDVLCEGGMALRGTFLIDREGIVQSQVVNNLDLGRGSGEILRTLKALQYTEKHGAVCPANWNTGDEAMRPTPEGLKAYFERH